MCALSFSLFFGLCIAPFIADIAVLFYDFIGAFVVVFSILYVKEGFQYVVDGRLLFAGDRPANAVHALCKCTRKCTLPVIWHRTDTPAGRIIVIQNKGISAMLQHS